MNCKIRLYSDDEAKEAVEILKEFGCRWNGGGDVPYGAIKDLYCIDYLLTLSSFHKDCFEEDSLPELTLRQLKVIEPVDYTGCDPQIAELLKKGFKVKCKCWDTTSRVTLTKVVLNYNKDRSYPYLTADGDRFINAKIAAKELYVKKASEIAKILEDVGYTIDGDGNWRKDSNIGFNHKMFRYCGKLVPKNWIWRPIWLEER
jgi:hypothetical protein